MAVLVKDIAAVVKENHNLNQTQSLAIVKDVFGAVADALVAGEDVQITNFGTFKPHTRAERKGRNPQTGEELLIPATKTASFKLGKQLRDAIKNS